MINKNSVKHRNIPVQRFFVLFAVAVLSLFFSVNVQAKVTKTVYASKLSGDLWDFYYNDDISLNIILDKDCTVDGIWVRFSDWEYDGDVKITGNGHKLIVGNGGICVSNETNLVIENAVIEIDTSEKYSNGSFYDGIYSGSDLTIIRSNIEIHSNAKRMAINTMQLHTDEYAVITGSYYDTYYSIRSDHPIGNVNVSVTEPKAGEKAVFKGSVEDKNIQLTVGTLDDEKIRWYEGGKEYKETDNLTFECGHTYKCVVNLSARLGKVSSVTSVKINEHTAAFAEGTTNIYGAERLRIKESDRLKAISEALCGIGADVEEKEDGLIIHGVKSADGGFVNGCNDHRIVMSMAIAVAKCRGAIEITDRESINKSYPSFFEDYRKINGKF